MQSLNSCCVSSCVTACPTQHLMWRALTQSWKLFDYKNPLTCKCQKKPLYEVPQFMYKLLSLQRPVTTILLTHIEFPLKRYRALAKVADETDHDTKEDLPKTKNLMYIHSCHHASRNTATTWLC